MFGKLLLFIVIFVRFSYASSFFTARSMALQNTTVALFAAESVSMNPAMITLQRYEHRDSLYLSTTKVFLDANSFYLSFVKNKYKIGMDFFYQDYGKIENLGKVFVSNLLKISIAKKFNPIYSCEIGMNLSYQKQNLDIYYSEFFSLNIGVLKVIDKFIIALVGRNVFSTEYKFITTKEKIPLSVELGMSYNIQMFSIFSQVSYEEKFIKKLPLSLEYRISTFFSAAISYDIINSLLNIGCSFIFKQIFVDIGYSFSLITPIRPFSFSLSYFF